MIIETKDGSATTPRPGIDGHVNGVIVAHLCNHVGAWGSGFVVAVTKDMSPIPEAAYRALVKKYPKGQCPLGLTQMLEIEPRLWVANMIAQNGIDKSMSSGCLVDYTALQKCLKVVFRRAVVLKCNVHMPAGMGSVLAGGDQDMIMDIIKSLGTSADITDLEQKMNFGPTVIMWNFMDKSAPSYIAPADAAPMDDGATVPATLDRGIDLSDDAIDLSEFDV